MKDVLIAILSFVVIFVLIFVYQMFFVVRKATNNGFKKIPIEINYILYKFHLDLKKINLFDLLKKNALIEAFDIAFVYAFVSYFIDNIYLRLLFSLLLLIPVIIISYNILGNIYVKKGLVKEK